MFKESLGGWWRRGSCGSTGGGLPYQHGEALALGVGIGVGPQPLALTLGRTHWRHIKLICGALIHDLTSRVTTGDFAPLSPGAVHRARRGAGMLGWLPWIGADGLSPSRSGRPHLNPLPSSWPGVNWPLANAIGAERLRGVGVEGACRCIADFPWQGEARGSWHLLAPRGPHSRRGERLTGRMVAEEGVTKQASKKCCAAAAGALLPAPRPRAMGIGLSGLTATR
jgi:hypothetical protein